MGSAQRRPVGRDAQAARRRPQHTRQGESRETRCQDVLGPLQGLSEACVAWLCARGWGGTPSAVLQGTCRAMRLRSLPGIKAHGNVANGIK